MSLNWTPEFVVTLRPLPDRTDPVGTRRLRMGSETQYRRFVSNGRGRTLSLNSTTSRRRESVEEHPEGDSQEHGDCAHNCKPLVKGISQCAGAQR